MASTKEDANEASSQQSESPKGEGEKRPSEIQVEEASDDEEEHMPASQVTLSQTDETIRRLEKQGDLTEVVGSQSMLSQELMYQNSQSSEPSESGQDDEEEEYDNFQSSQQTETSLSMAQRFGLLTQDDEWNMEGQAASSRKTSRPGFTESQESVINRLVQSSNPPTTAETTKKTSGISDTPVRESECFGSLLDAVQKITEQEDVNSKLYSLQYRTSEDGAHVKTEKKIDAPTPQQPSDDDNPEPSTPTTTNKASNVKRKTDDDSSPQPSPKKLRKSTAAQKKEREKQEAEETAKRAAALAQQTVADPEMAKKLLLSMALVRENPRSVPTTLPPRGSEVPEGFFWAHYPPLENVLKGHMAEYYELSTTKCQSAQQQAFNNCLVVLVRQAAKEKGWKFHQSFSDKCLRDRIRCYYKTHIQNAKKRLRTMVRNPTKRANARHLCAHLDLIEQHGSGEQESTSLGKESEKSDPSKATEVKQDPDDNTMTNSSTTRVTRSSRANKASLVEV